MLLAAACKDLPNTGAGGSGGGAAGSGGVAAGSAGRGGGGGMAGQAGGTTAPLTSCPASRPTPGTACTGTFICNYDVMCICGTCCMYGYQCSNGAIVLLGFNDACTQVNPQSCRDAAADATDGNTDARGPVCTPGANQSCNDNPAVSSIHGTCTDAGTCVCNNDASPNPTSGRCP